MTSRALLAVVAPTTGELRWEHFTERIDRQFTGPIYTVEPAMSRCVVTPNHHMLVSPVPQSEYRVDKAEWSLVPFSTLSTGTRSRFHTRRRLEVRMKEYEAVTDEYLALAGLYLAKGTIQFRDGKVETVRLTQSKNESLRFFAAVDRLMGIFGFQKTLSAEETIWTAPRPLAQQLANDFGPGVDEKWIPFWGLELSARQAQIIWSHACLSEGVTIPDGDICSVSNAGLAGDLQAMLTCAGVLCSVRGPDKCHQQGGYFSNGGMSQVYRPHDQHPYSCVDFRTKFIHSGDESPAGSPITERQVSGERIVCFQVPTGTLITRSQGKVALHGNTKFGYHLIRLLNEVEQIMVEGDLDLMRNREQLKDIRNGLWTEEQLEDYFARKEIALEEVYNRSSLPWGPDEGSIKELLLNVLEEHYGSLDRCIVREDEAVTALREAIAWADRYRHLVEVTPADIPGQVPDEVG